MRHAPIMGSRDAPGNAASATIFPSSSRSPFISVHYLMLARRTFPIRDILKVNSQSVYSEKFRCAWLKNLFLFSV